MTDPALLLSELFFTRGHPDPYRLYRELRHHGDLHDTGITLVALGYELCDGLLRDRRFTMWDQWPQGQPRFAESAWLRSAASHMVYADPPDHTRLRSNIGRVFSPRTIQDLRPYVRSLIGGWLDTAGEKGCFDLIADVAAPLPVTVVGELIGIPEADREQCHRWTHAIVQIIGNLAATPEQWRAADEATVSIEAYLRELVAERRRVPGDDLISRLATAGDWRSDDELVSNVSSLIGGGFETTIFSVGNSVNALLRHPDQLALLRSDPSLMPGAVEELLRYDSPLQFTTPRTARQQVTVAGVTVEAGQSVMPMLAAANHDPNHVADPDRLDVQRPAPRPIAFGAGIHHCIGAALARLEIQEALAGLLDRFRAIEPIDDEVAWVESFAFRGPKALRLSVARR